MIGAYVPQTVLGASPQKRPARFSPGTPGGVCGQQNRRAREDVPVAVLFFLPKSGGGAKSDQYWKLPNAISLAMETLLSFRVANRILAEPMLMVTSVWCVRETNLPSGVIVALMV